MDALLAEHADDMVGGRHLLSPDLREAPHRAPSGQGLHAVPTPAGEIGQLLVLAVMLPALAVLLRYVFVGRLGTIVLSAIIANVAWDWMVERGGILWRTEWPQLDPSGLASVARWVAGALVVGGVVSLAAKRLRDAGQTIWPRFHLGRARRGEPGTGVKGAP